MRPCWYAVCRQVRCVYHRSHNNREVEVKERCHGRGLGQRLGGSSLGYPCLHEGLPTT